MDWRPIGVDEKRFFNTPGIGANTKANTQELDCGVTFARLLIMIPDVQH